MPDAVRFEDVSLWRRTQEELGYDLKRLVFSMLTRSFRAPRRRKVIDGMSFAVRQGEKFGIIGPNGSGKSTVLKLIAGILRPTSGSVAVRGVVAPLIELGAGFDADLSVEDNIVYNGILLGNDRRFMRSRVDAILDFAELQEHRRVPLKALSSGMLARLGFAIATDVRPDVLLVDEVLSVGDESFRHRSEERLREIWTEHATILLVSHDIGFVAAQCERVLWIDAGGVRALGPSADVANRYLADVAKQEAAARRTVFLDAPTHGCVDVVRAENGRLWVQGWGLLPDGRRGSRVSVLVDGLLLGEGIYGDVRPDVAAQGTDDMLACGFHADLPAERIPPGRRTVTVVLYDARDDRHHPLPSRDVAVVPVEVSTILR